MPLLKVISLSENTKLCLWKITEDLDTLFREVQLKDTSLARLESMKSDSHKKGFLGVRMILQHLGYNDYDLYYDAFGKPHLKGESHVSISHSHDFSAVVVSNEIVGLDLEQLKDKILKIAPKYMNCYHLEHLPESEKIQKATVIWGIKESIFKIKNEKGISFSQHIFEGDFLFENKKAKAQLRFNGKVEDFDIVFDFIEDYIYVCAFNSVPFGFASGERKQ